MSLQAGIPEGLAWGDYMYNIDEALKSPRARAREDATFAAAAARRNRNGQTHARRAKTRALRNKVASLFPTPPAGLKPRKGKTMKQCRATYNRAHCARHETGAKDCKFVHKDEPEWALLRVGQKQRKSKKAKSAPSRRSAATRRRSL